MPKLSGIVQDLISVTLAEGVDFRRLDGRSLELRLIKPRTVKSQLGQVNSNSDNVDCGTMRSTQEKEKWKDFCSSFKGAKHTGVCVYEVMKPEFKEQSMQEMGLKGPHEVFCRKRFPFVSKYVLVAPMMDIRKTRFSLLRDLTFTPHWIAPVTTIEQLLFKKNVDPPVEYIYPDHDSKTKKLDDVNVWNSIDEDLLKENLTLEERESLESLLESDTLDTIFELVMKYGSKDEHRLNTCIDYGSSCYRNSSRAKSADGISFPNTRKLPKEVPEEPFKRACELLSILFRSRVTKENLPARFTEEAQGVTDLFEHEWPSFRFAITTPEGVLRPHCDDKNDDKEGLSPVGLLQKICEKIDANGAKKYYRLACIGYPRKCMRLVKEKQDRYKDPVDIAVKYYRSLPDSRRVVSPALFCPEPDLWSSDKDTNIIMPAHMCKTIYYGSVNHVVQSMTEFLREQAELLFVAFPRARIQAAFFYSSVLNENLSNFHAFGSFVPPFH